MTNDRVVRSVLRHLNARAINQQVRRELRSRQHHLPPVSVYRWWARRPESVISAIVEAAEQDRAGRLVIADPFAGGGVIALTALVAGHQVYAQDVNPWAARNLVTMLDLPQVTEITAARERLHALIEPTLAAAYATVLSDGSPGEIAQTLRVACANCPTCRRRLYLYPGALVSLTERVDRGGRQGYLACAAGHLQFGDASTISRCETCTRDVDPRARYTAGRVVVCPHCAWTGRLSDLMSRPSFGWQVALVERVAGHVREIGQPSAQERRTAADDTWPDTRSLPVIGHGVETSVLRRHGFSRWGDLYPLRQRAMLDAMLRSCRRAAAHDDRVERALRAAILGSVEMAGLASRWDPRYLKAYESVSNHRFTVTTLSAEPNVWGAMTSGRGTVSRRLDHIAKAAVWLEEQLGRHATIEGPLPASARRRRLSPSTDVRVVEGSSTRLVVPPGSLDLVLTDPPYHDDVQYGELSALFRAWAGIRTGELVGDAIVRSTSASSTTKQYRAVLSGVFREVRRGLAPHGHLVLSYANRNPKAWVALFDALQSAEFHAIGYEIIRSENELDHAKAGKRACTLDVLIDLIPRQRARIAIHRPDAVARPSPERGFCTVVGEQALQIGSLTNGWQEAFEAQLRRCRFLQ